MYGITETTVHVTYRPLSLADLDTPASVIGVPIPDLLLYILDEAAEPAPIGVPGEMYVGGAGVARGYLNRPELTAERFVHMNGRRLYKTGDLARFLADGDVEYLGRADQQVKVRGFRIELGEIEAALSQHPAIAETVVLARRRDDGSNQLVAYVVPAGDGLDVVDLRAHLERRLPDYMVPSAFVALASLPLTANGKLDRAALPDPSERRIEAGRFVEPADGLEQTIAGVLRDVLRVDRVGAHDNFFDLGADSLLVAVAHARIREALGRDLSLVALYKHPTVGTLAAALAAGARSPAPDQSAAIDARAGRQRQARAARKRT
jgi:aryl carrier-like protein